MQMQEPNRKLPLAMALMAIVVVGSVIFPVFNKPSSKATTLDSVVFPSISSGLYAFSMFCLTNKNNFDSLKRDLREIGGPVAEVLKDGVQNEIYSMPYLKGTITLSTGVNHQACGLLTATEYFDAEAATTRWFFDDAKSSHFQMFSDPSRVVDHRFSGEHTWMLDSPDGKQKNVVHVADRSSLTSSSMTSITHTIIDFNK